MNTINTRQRGFVSILTVLFFTTLISVITISFTTLMIQERRQELEDELTKSAYDSALAGVEDAKKAIAYCSSLTVAVDKANCEAQLYELNCPGFNSAVTAYGTLGVIASDAGRTSVTGEDATTAPQGYSCVLVSPNVASIDGSLSATSGEGAMYELATAATTVTLSWEQDTALLQPTFLTGGNPRLADWSWPALMRVTIITALKSNPTIADMTSQTTFVYPTSAAIGTLSSGPTKRINSNCNGVGPSGCKVNINLSSFDQTNRKIYIVLSSLYKDTKFTISNSASSPFSGAQIGIDSTGYTSGVARRVLAKVRTGGNSINTANALDTGLGFCKNFTVTTDPVNFENNTSDSCKPD